MRKKRKVTVEIEHQEISFSAGSGGVVPPGTPKGRDLGRPLTCPTCGGAVLLTLAQAMAEPGFTKAMLDRDPAGNGLHIGRSGSGEWWVCRGSIRDR